MTLPFLLMTLHLSHIGFTDGLTFIFLFLRKNSFARIPRCGMSVYCDRTGHSPLPRQSVFAAPGDPALREIVRAHFQFDHISRDDPDIIHTKFSGNVCRDHMTVGKLHFKRRIRQRLDDFAFGLYNVVFGHKNSLRKLFENRFCGHFSVLPLLRYPFEQCADVAVLVLARRDPLRHFAVEYRHESDVPAVFLLRIFRSPVLAVGKIQVCAVLPHDQIQPAFISSGNAHANAAIFRFLYFHVC